MSIIKSRIFIRALFLLFLFTPTLSFAAGNIGFDGLNNLILDFANKVVRSTGYMMFTLAVVAFFFGIVQFIWSARQGSEGKGIQRGTQFMKWGLIALFVMFSVWGIIKFAQGVFGIQGDNTIIVPSLNFIQSGVDNTAGSVTKLAAGVGCTNTSQCASGLTCVGNNATNKVCTASGSQSCVAPKVWVNGNCTTPSGTVTCTSPYVLNSSGLCINPTTGAPAPVAGQSANNAAFDACIAAGGGVQECKAQTGSVGGGKGLGFSCTKNSECSSGFCDPKDDTCSTPQQVGQAGLGFSCTKNSECSSGFCDPKDDTCSTPQNVSYQQCLTNGGTVASCQGLPLEVTGQTTVQLVAGCMDINASNFDVNATVDAGCEY